MVSVERVVEDDSVTYPETSGPNTGPRKGDIVYTAMGLSKL